jgi:hypothetical protein
MLRAVARILIAAVALLGSAPWSFAEDCEVITATHSAQTKGEALVMSQALAAKSAEELRQKKGWSRISITAQKVPPNPFFKKWRREVPDYALEGAFVTAKTYSTCFTGVSVPFVCTTGSKVCRN